jgi:hypothetical protein
MSKISRRPIRNAFRKECLAKQLEEGETTQQHADEMTDLFKSWEEQKLEMEETSDWQENNMEYDLRTTDWILEKARSSELYAQHLYAALCNNDFQKNDVMPILKNKTWGCSWRYAGGVIADMRESGDYMDWYCSGIRGDKLSDSEFADLTEDQKVAYLESQAYVSESMVTDEIRADLFRLGWLVVDSEESSLI